MFVQQSCCLPTPGIQQEARDKVTLQGSNPQHVHSTHSKPVVEESIEHGKSPQWP